MWCCPFARIFTVLLLVGGCLFVGLSCIPTNTVDDAPEPDPDPRFPVGAFSLTERSGRQVSGEDLRGKVWVASFVFTRCTGPCPQVTATMARLQTELQLDRHADLRLVTFTVDPERDRPAELQSYADNFRAHKDRWLFLTGQEDEIHRLLREGFRVGVQENPSPDPKPGEEFTHSTRLAVVDHAGRVRGYYSGLPSGPSEAERKDFEADLKKLRAKVAALLAESPDGHD